MIYLDYNSTAPMRPEVIQAMTETMQLPANASSVHALGRKAKQQLEEARKVVADAVSAWPNEVIFTSSGTEANNMALRSFYERPLLVGATDHSSVTQTAKRVGGDTLPVDGEGLIDLDVLESKLRSLKQPAFVSVMLANNETGVIQPVEKISKLTRQYDAILHCDAVQALGKMTVDMGALGADMLTISAHKFGGPVGVGALVARQDLPVKPLIIGGGQEQRRRGGTQSVALATGFAVAIQCGRSREWVKPVEDWLAHMEESICKVAPDAIIIGGETGRLSNTSMIMMPGVTSETQMMTFDLEGVCVSAGSACSSGRVEPSHVLKAMGYSEKTASSVIRISAGWNTQEGDIKYFTELWQKTYMRLAKKAA